MASTDSHLSRVFRAGPPTLSGQKEPLFSYTGRGVIADFHAWHLFDTASTFR